MSPSTFFDLINALSSLNVDKFQPFELIETQYKNFGQGNGAVSTDVLIPKALLEKDEVTQCPIMVRIHGGFLVTGSSRYAPWFSNWILNYSLRSQAIIVSPNYRLLPEANGEEILKDMEDFWDWLHAGGLVQSMEKVGLSRLIPDLERILMLGESAGGYLAVQLALSHPMEIQGVIAAYPMLDLKAPFYTESYAKPIVGVSNLPNTEDPPARLELAFSIVQNARFLEFFGSENPDLFPMERVEQLSVSSNLQLPPFFIFHGEQDSAVPADGSRKFVSLLRQKFPTVDVRLYIQDGDHGFDADATLEAPWLRDGLKMASSAWAKPTSSRSH